MNNTSKQFAIYGAVFMALAVSLGAFGAHGLKAIVSKEMLVIYHTGVEYQFYHALGLFAVSFIASFQESTLVKRAGYFMIAGIVIFSGSLYAITLSGIKILGAITPIGGVSFIVAWILLVFSIKKI
ncbi:DUF423 domain-containing protein [Sulfurospirillum arcachonense]|uniref:DUF423 domain-containing protein n=1 Tax=Sulfurospirillum arcachonense TaxID=57666 RepID=UPI0004680393|nr:DUF423 domain-containing protein [Sulfurospirillum arcachonense]